MSLLITLPEAIVGNVLDEWLILRYLGKLDTAHGNKKERRDFLAILGRLTLLARKLDVISTKASTLRWIHTKSIKFQRICVHWKGLSDKLAILEEILIDHKDILKSLEFIGNLDLTSNSNNARMVVTQCSSLERLLIERVCFDRKIIPAFAASNGTLRKLELMECENISRAACTAIANCCPNLEVLDLRITDVDDGGLKMIVRGCNKLTELELFACRNITDKGIDEVVGRRGSKLTHLSISDTSATEASIVAIARGCPLLRNLNLERVPVVTPRCAAEVGKGCPLLENLSFVGCGAVSGERSSLSACSRFRLRLCVLLCCADDALVAISEGCPKMKHLFLCECENITDVGLRALATLPALRYVAISANVGVQHKEAVRSFPASVRVHLDGASPVPMSPAGQNQGQQQGQPAVQAADQDDGGEDAAAGAAPE
jgi:hypothetical protein